MLESKHFLGKAFLIPMSRVENVSLSTFSGGARVVLLRIRASCRQWVLELIDTFSTPLGTRGLISDAGEQLL